QRTGRKQHALLLQTDHVFEVARQMLGELFGRRAALGEDDVELFTKHGLGELADALLRHRLPPLRAAYRAPLSRCTAASMARRPAAIKDRARGSTHSVPLFFPVNNRRKTGGRAQPGVAGFPVSSGMTTGNARDRRRVGRPGLPSITGPSRTKTGNRRNPSLQDPSSSFQTRARSPGFAAPLPHARSFG